MEYSFSYKTITLFMVLLFLSKFCLLAQQKLSGYVFEKASKEPISNVNILIKATEGKLITFATTNKEGYFSINLPLKFEELIIEASIISHVSVKKTLTKIKSKNIYSIGFELIENFTNLGEVYVESKRKINLTKKDTTIYAVSAFKDGSESVVEDILKKLPGITITDNGTLKFKGKQVVSVLLDGDNLFNDNYTIGTKNIGSEIIEEIQAIEDYNKNPLLKGIKSSEDVAINLILKKGETDISGDVDLGIGIQSKQHLKTNIISVSKKLKGFGSISYNNVGKNYSPYNFTSNSLDISSLNEYNQRTNELLTSNRLRSNLSDERIRINKSLFSTLNLLYKLNEDISLRFNYDFFKDKLTRTISTDNLYNIESENFTVSSFEDYSFLPLINNFEYELIYYPSKKSLLTSSGKLDNKIIDIESKGSNNNEDFNSLTNSENLFLSNKIEYTYRINSENIFQIQNSIATNKTPEFLDLEYVPDIATQSIYSRKNSFNILSKFLSKKHQDEYSISLGYDFKEHFFNSNLTGVDQNDLFLTNAIYYRILSPFLSGSYQFRAGNWKINAELQNIFYNSRINDANLRFISGENNFEIYPSIRVNYYLTKEKHLYSSYKLTNQLPEVDKIFSGIVLTDFRSLMNNDFRFNLLNYHSATIGYRISDFFNLFQFNLFTEYHYSKNGFINSSNISQDFNLYSSRIYDVQNKNLKFGVDLEKYLSFLKSTININSSYQVSDYKNIVNNSGIRSNTSNSLFGAFHIRTGFKSPLNFEYKFRGLQNSFKSDSSDKNSFTLLRNDFKIKYNKNNFSAILLGQYFNSDVNDNATNDFFLDFSASFKPKNGKLEYTLNAINLLNDRIYRSVNASDYFTTATEHNLLERYLLFSISFKY